MWKWLETLLATIEEALQGDYVPPEQPEQPTPVVTTPPPLPTPPVEPPLPVNPTPMTQTKAEKLYALSKSLIGFHLSMNDAVPWGVGCAEAVSELLLKFDIAGIPKGGIEGTALLETFLINSAQFQEIYTYTQGAVLVAATGSGNGKIRGHTGVAGFNSIMSNNSETGKWDTQWDIARFVAYYETYGGMKVRYFLPV